MLKMEVNRILLLIMIKGKQFVNNLYIIRTLKNIKKNLIKMKEKTETILKGTQIF